jgi:colanic acid/amylovoran biosynthesis glycosyltransferase
MLAICVPVVGVASETFIRRHVERLAPGRTVVLARRPAPQAERTWDVDVPVLYLDALVDEWGGARECAAVAEFLSAHGVKSILAEYLDVWLPFVDVFAGHGGRLVAHGHGYDISARLDDPWWREEYRAWTAADAVVVMSQAARDRLAQVLPDDRIAVVPYGVDLPDLESAQAPRAGTRVLAVGRCVPKKAPLTTLEAFRRAADAAPGLHLTYVGDGPLLAELQERARGLSVSLPGALPNERVLELFTAADVFCQHSVRDPETGDEEGLPVAILEAMAHALPVVATRHAGIPDAIQDGVNGYLVEEHDIAGMAERLAQLARDRTLRRTMGLAGRELAESSFSWPAESARLRDLLDL